MNYQWSEWSVCDKPCGYGKQYTYKECTKLDKGQNELDCKPIAYFKNSMKEYFKRDKLCFIRPCYNWERDNFIQLKHITKSVFYSFLVGILIFTFYINYYWYFVA
jgi:hypothetical protein